MALYCLQLDECDCKGSSFWVSDWVTNLYNPAATFAHLLCLHNLRERLNERDRKKGKGGNDRGRKRERQLMKEEGGDGEQGAGKKMDQVKGQRREGWPLDMVSVKY